MFTKVFGPADGSYSDPLSWLPINVRSAAYTWTASGSGTNEYYLRTAGSADPGFADKPGKVYIDGAEATEGTAGSLSAGQWDYGDNDTLGYDTLYVRLSDGADPDSKPDGFVKFFQVPQAGEDVRFTPESGDVTDGFDQSGVAIGAFVAEEGNSTAFGRPPDAENQAVYLQINPTSFEFNGNGIAYIDIGAAAISPTIRDTARAGQGERGLYIKGSAISILNVIGGSVGLAVNAGETATATTVRVMAGSADVALGSGCSITNLHQYGGSVLAHCSITTTILYDGTLETREAGTMTTVTQHGGTYIYGSSGNITTFNLHGGTFDETRSGASRTITTANLYRGSYRIMRNKEAVTHTTDAVQDSLTMSVSATSGNSGFGIG
jgi:hypothetical protein